MDKPSVGRIVHYVAYGTPGGEFPAGICRAAVITEVEDPVIWDGDHVTSLPQGSPRVGMCVLNPTGLYFNRGIPYDEQKAPGLVNAVTVTFPVAEILFM